MQDLNVVNDSLRYKNSMLVIKVKSLENDLVVYKSDLSNSSNVNLDCILSSQKPLGNTCELEFDKSS